MREYKVEVEREDRWWMVHIPEIDGLTQARRVDEIEDMARSYIAVDTDTPLSDVSVHVVSIRIPKLGDVAGETAFVKNARAVARKAEQDAVETTAACARRLTGAGIPVRDVAALLNVSPQRVSQIA
ncbi:hypothetical protein [Mycobacterium malmoense]|uniref:hypothetical protein n=1 Tax=Mycobacterium malmoense TaxID=1780 RepID=UPI0008F888A9|nr:hypothetical protein [Mycobacterium malmoense]OIN79195.1 hypothetical protein BMG05_19285 [Mycobacterium malmoense]